MYRNLSNHRRKETSPTGSMFKNEYQEEVTKEGKRQLVKTGKTNTYELIQASYENTKIENILARAQQGDPYALNKTHGEYIDVTDAPKSLAEAQNIIVKIKNEFYNLPNDVKASFNFNPEEYVAQYGTEDWTTKLGLRPEETPTPETKPEEGAPTENE